MKLARRQILQLAAGAAALPAVSRFAWAQAYPARPITLVVPFAAGGPTDTIARIMGERMRASLGQTIIIENTTGAAGSIGVGRVARAEPDGYTVGIGHWSTHVAIYQLPYDMLNDFEPISLVTIARIMGEPVFPIKGGRSCGTQRIGINGQLGMRSTRSRLSITTDRLHPLGRLLI